MEIILNDLSIEDCFFTLEEFENYACSKLKPLLDRMNERGCCLLKKTDTYSRRLPEGRTLMSYVCETGNPVAANLRSNLLNLFRDEPFWDDATEMRTRPDCNYIYPYDYEEPNCITEALERQSMLLSFPKKEFSTEVIIGQADDKEIQIVNLLEQPDFLKEWLKKYPDDVRYVFEHYPFSKSVVFVNNGNKCPIGEDLRHNSLDTGDILKIVEHIPNLIKDKSNGHKSHWWDSVAGSISEYRVTVSGDREFRIFFLWETSLIFLCGYIKKTETIPKKEKERAVRIAKVWKGN